MAEEKNIIIKRVKKSGHAHHGGAWKVAYADFVTAMMAFFLLLWLLNSVTEEQLEGISNYFAPTAISASDSGAGGMLGGQSIGQGANQSNTSSSSSAPTLPPPTVGMGGNDFTDPAEGFTLEEDQPDLPSGESDNMGPGDGPSDESDGAGSEAEQAQEESFEGRLAGPAPGHAGGAGAGPASGQPVDRGNPRRPENPACGPGPPAHVPRRFVGNVRTYPAAVAGRGRGCRRSAQYPAHHRPHRRCAVRGPDRLQQLGAVGGSRPGQPARRFCPPASRRTESRPWWARPEPSRWSRANRKTRATAASRSP